MRTNSAGSKISVCLLTFNHVDLVESTIRSIQNQSVEDYEIIVSDDCSTDGTWERVLEIAATDERIRPVRTPRNCGMPGNANFAVEHSQRPYLALLHHDDIYRADLLEKWAGVLDRHQDIGFVFNSYHLHGSNRVDGGPMPGERIEGKWLLNNFLLPHWGCVIRGTAMIRREAWLQAGGMREEFNLLADIDLWMRLAMKWNAGYVNEPIISVRDERPSYYPEMYRDTAFSWRRQRYLYEIHAVNRKELFAGHSLIGWWNWWTFRLRLSVETAKWLLYAVVRRKPALIASSRDAETDYDLWPLRAARSFLIWRYAPAHDLHQRC